MTLAFDQSLLLIRLGWIVACWLILRFSFRGFHLHAFVWLPATLAHELAHLLVGLLVRARPVEFSIWPRRVPGTRRYVLGHVGFLALNWWKKLPVATAPLWLLFPLTVVLAGVSLRTGLSSVSEFIYCFAALQCLEGSWPSSQDWALARHTLYALLAVIFVGAIVYAVASTGAIS